MRRLSNLAVLVEPLGLIGWCLLGLVWLTRRRSRGIAAWATVALTAGYFWVATPLGANVMLRAVEGDPAAAPACRGVAASEAIVALAGGVSHSDSQDPPVSRLKEASFRRTISAAALTVSSRDARLILSGGSGYPEGEAELMRELAVAFGVPPDRIVVEPRSRSTAESAALVGGIVRRLGIKRIHLVTSALHMRRAARSFEAQGIRVCRHPVDWRQVPLDLRFVLLPQISAMEKSTDAIREIMAGLWYRISGRFAPARAIADGRGKPACMEDHPRGRDGYSAS